MRSSPALLTALRELVDLPANEALELGFLAGQAAQDTPRTTAFVLDRDFVVRGADGDSMMHLPWFATDMFVERSLPDIYEMPHHVREGGLRNYAGALGGERRLWSFESYGLGYEVDSVPVTGAGRRPVAVLALCRLVRDPDDEGVMALTPREREILQHAADGLSGPEIADALTLSAATVKTHFQNIYAKCGVSDRAGAVAKALRKRAIF